MKMIILTDSEYSPEPGVYKSLDNKKEFVSTEQSQKFPSDKNQFIWKKELKL